MFYKYLVRCKSGKFSQMMVLAGRNLRRWSGLRPLRRGICIERAQSPMINLSLDWYRMRQLSARLQASFACRELLHRKRGDASL